MACFVLKPEELAKYQYGEMDSEKKNKKYLAVLLAATLAFIALQMPYSTGWEVQAAQEDGILLLKMEC